MYIVDDSTLALITRFLGDTPNLNLSDAEFLLHQIAAIEQYVGQFPPNQRQKRALEWVEVHARQYRQQWQKQAVSKVLTQARCPDCPLAGDSESSPCAVHSRWLQLLRCYASDKISSREYVEATLKLLGEYKNRLKVSRPQQCLRQAIPALDPG
ncbi:MAG: hypothetical protein U1F42_03615 [Candidatus Competibacteraceae bacterium]